MRKVSQTTNPNHRYIHMLLTRGVRGCSKFTGVVSHTNLLMLYSAFERYLIHMGHFFIDISSHQGQYVHLGTIFTGPYIT